MKKINALLVEDSSADAVMLNEQISAVPGGLVKLTHVTKFHSAMELLETDEFDIILLDLSLPDSTGLRTLFRMRSRVPEHPIIVLTGLDDESTAMEAMRNGAQDYLNKGKFDGEVLIRAIRYSIERKHLEDRINNLVQMERHRIGREIHDDIGQVLTGVSMMAQTLQGKLSRKGMDESNDAEIIAEQAKQAVKRASLLVRGLFSLELQTSGLCETLGNFSKEMSDLFSVKCTFKFDPSITIGNRPAASHIYRIVQESVNNAVKHGNPKKIQIELSRNDGDVELTIKNDGRKYQHQKLKKSQKSKSSNRGISIMEYRAKMVGGTFQISSDGKSGAIVKCTFPDDCGIIDKKDFHAHKPKK